MAFIVSGFLFLGFFFFFPLVFVMCLRFFLCILGFLGVLVRWDTGLVCCYLLIL